jgi:hypothetical protein
LEAPASAGAAGAAVTAEAADAAAGGGVLSDWDPDMAQVCETGKEKVRPLYHRGTRDDTSAFGSNGRSPRARDACGRVP